MYHTVFGITFVRNSRELRQPASVGLEYLSHWFQTYQFAISFITTATIHHSFSLPLHHFCKSFPPYFIYLSPTGLNSWISAAFVVYSGMSVLTLVLYTRLSWPQPLASFQAHIKSLHITIIIIIIIINYRTHQQAGYSQFLSNGHIDTGGVVCNGDVSQLRNKKRPFKLRMLVMKNSHKSLTLQFAVTCLLRLLCEHLLKGYRQMDILSYTLHTNHMLAVPSILITPPVTCVGRIGQH